MNSSFLAKGDQGLFLQRLERFKRFGVLCFAYRQSERNRPKLLPDRVRGVFLGCSKASNSYLVGCWRVPKHKEAVFETLETESVRFTNYLVRDVAQLRPDSHCVSVSVDELIELDNSLTETKRLDWEPEDDVYLSTPGTVERKMTVLGLKDMKILEKDNSSMCESTPPFKKGGESEEENRSPVVPEYNFPFKIDFEEENRQGKGKANVRTAHVGPQEFTKVRSNFCQNGRSFGANSQNSSRVGRKRIRHPSLDGESIFVGNSRPPRDLLDPSGTARVGQKWRDMGNRPGKKVRTNDCETVNIGFDQEIVEGDFANIPEYLRAKDEELIESHVYLSVKDALASPESTKWVEAISKEKAKLEANKTWRKLSSTESRGEKQVAPIALLLSQKRDGSHKRRAVVLGNQLLKKKTP